MSSIKLTIQTEPEIELISESPHADTIRSILVTSEPKGFLTASEEGKVAFWVIDKKEGQEARFYMKSEFSLEHRPQKMTQSLTGNVVSIHCENIVYELHATKDREGFNLAN
jgi:hypothetical protein